MSTAIRVQGLHKLYRRMAPGFRFRTLKSALLDRSLTAGLDPEETIAAISDVTFEVERGKAFGVIGSNGSGKSTLLKILAGMLKPSSGRVEVDGRVAALIELGAGFHPEISGRENIFINGAVLGLSRKQLEERYDEIVAFSGLGSFIEEPVKNYSSGMYVRLGFAVAIHTDPDILLVDEVLAVGDEAFQHRCLRRIEEFLAAGRTLLLVTHSLDLVEHFADEVLWLEKGRKRLAGNPRRVADAYRQMVAEEEGRGHQQAKEQRQEEMAQEDQAVSVEAPPQTEEAGPDSSISQEVDAEARRWGSREAEIVAVRLLDAEGEERYHLMIGGRLVVELEISTRQRLSDFVFGVGIFTPRGVECWGVNTQLAGYAPSALEGKSVVRLVCPSIRLAPGEYLLDVAVHARDGYPYDYHRRYLGFSVTSSRGGVGIYFPEHHWEFEGSVQWKEVPEVGTGE